MNFVVLWEGGTSWWNFDPMCDKFSFKVFLVQIMWFMQFLYSKLVEMLDLSLFLPLKKCLVPFVAIIRKGGRDNVTFPNP